MGFARRVLVFLVALAGLVDGGVVLGAPLAAWSSPGSLIGYLPTSLLLLGGAVGAALGGTIAANVADRTSRARFLPVLAVTVITGVVLAVAQTWGLEHWLHESLRRPLFLATLIVIPLVATWGGTAFRLAEPAPAGKRSIVMIGAIIVILVLAVLVLLFVYFVAAATTVIS